MTFRNQQAPEEEDEAFGLSGWLYADLLLGLAVIFLATAFFFVRDSDDAVTIPTTTMTTEPPRNQVDELENALRDLEKENRDLERESAIAGQGLEEAEEEIGDLRKGLEEAEEETGDLESENLDLRGDNRELTLDLSDALEERDEGVPATPPGVEQGFYCFRIGRVDKRDGDALTADVNSELARLGILNRTVGIALSFGVSKESTGPGSGHAKWFNDTILRPFPAFNQAALRNFWSGFGTGNGSPTSIKPDGSVEVNVYLMTKPGMASRTGDIEDRC